MKYFFSGILMTLTFLANAQNNTLLEASFWQTRPGKDQVKAEIEKGADPAELNYANFDPVTLAINANAPDETVKFLLSQKGNDVNKLTHDGRTYVFWAAYKGNTGLMEYLMANGAKLKNMVDNHGYSVLNFAAVTGQQNTKVYDFCIANGSDPKTELTHEGANALLLAVPFDSSGKLTEYFVSKGLDIRSKDSQGNTAFNYAAKAGNIEVMKTLVKKGIKPTDNAVIMATQPARQGVKKLETFKYLESAGVKMNAVSKTGDNALHGLARRAGQDDIIKYFLAKGAKADQANEEGNTAFMIAAASGNEIATLELLRSGVTDINKTNKAGLSALTMAVRNGNPAAVKYLIEKGANVNITDLKGDNLTAYLIDSYNPRQEQDFQAKLEVLTTAGLDIGKPQGNGNTVYHLAVAKNDIGLLKIFSGARGVDINAKNKEGFTALHKAAMISKDDTILKFLISAGAKKDIQTSFNETAFDLAAENENFSAKKISTEFLK